MLVVQNRIEDAGFSDIEVTTLGADKVLICRSSDVHVSTIINDAKEFFEHLFTNFVRWEKKVMSFQRGAWLRLYGILIHAWNETFFKLCTLDCGRFLRTDSCSVDQERFDYARVLIATSSFEIINCIGELMIDGDLVKVKILEEWGFNICDDACLYEEDEDGTVTQPEKEEGQVDPGIDVNADILVEKIVKDLVDSDGHVKSNVDVEFLDDSDSDFEPCTSSHSKQKPDGEFPMGTATTPVLLVHIVTHHVECASLNNNVDARGIVVNHAAHVEVRVVGGDVLDAEQHVVTVSDSHCNRKRTRTA